MQKFIVLFLAFVSLNIFADTEEQMARDAVKLYQTHSANRYRKPLKLTVSEDSSVNAYAKLSMRGEPIIDITSGALYELTGDGVLATICHELGHFFGHKQFSINPNDPRSMIIESEADYFAGFCLVNFLKSVRGYSDRKAIEEAVEIAKVEAPVYVQSRLDCNKAYSQSFPRGGWNQGYADPECRLLTVIHGARGWKRPNCWYNP